MDTFNVNLNNFQSISDAELEFVEGLNLIVGQSNSGKTAILRAINSVVDNPSRGKLYIKRGHKSTEVKINFEGKEFCWKRTPSDIEYVIDGEVFKKAGRNTLFDFEANSGFVKDDEGNVMNIEGEWNLPFPFDRTPSELFKLFENIFCISDSAVILKSFKEEEGNTVKERLKLEDSLSRVNKKIEGLEELTQEIDTEDYMDKAEAFKKNLEQYKELSADLVKLKHSEEFSKINLDEVVPPTEESVSSYVEAVKDYKFLRKVIQRQQFYKSLPASLIVGDTIDGYTQAYDDYQHVLKAHKLKQLDLDRECEVTGSTLDEYKELLKDYTSLKNLRTVVKLDLSKECEVGNTIDEYTELLADYKFIKDCYNMCKKKKEEYTKLDNRIGELQAKLNNYKVCPLCGHELGEKE